MKDFQTPYEWRRTVQSRPAAFLRAQPALWSLFEIPGDDPIWVPFGSADVEKAARGVQALFGSAGVTREDVILSVAPGGPWPGNALPYLLSASDTLLTGGDVITAEVLPLSAMTVAFRPDLVLFPLRRRPSVLLGDAADLQTVLAQATAQGAAPPTPRLALVYGNDGSHQFAPEQVSLLFLPGCLAPVGGLLGQRGVWLRFDVLHAEIVPDDEWARSVATPGRIPECVVATEALGVTGELVVTVENHCLPIERLRTHHRVQVMEVGPTGVRVEPIPVSRSARAYSAVS